MVYSGGGLMNVDWGHGVRDRAKAEDMVPLNRLIEVAKKGTGCRIDTKYRTVLSTPLLK